MTIWDEDSVCPLCGQTQDRWGLVPMWEDRVSRNAVRDVFHSIDRDRCSLASIKEKPGLLPPRAPDDGDPDPSGRDLCRPADIWVPHGAWH